MRRAIQVHLSVPKMFNLFLTAPYREVELMADEPLSARGAPTQHFLQHLVDHSGVGLALGALHDLAHEEVEGVFLAIPDILRGLGMSLEHFLDRLPEERVIADLTQPERLNHVDDPTLVPKHCLEDVLRLLL